MDRVSVVGAAPGHAGKRVAFLVVSPRPLRELLNPGWAAALAPAQDEIARLGDFLRAETAAGRGYLPSGPNVLRAFTYPFADVRVLIVGQDPYPTPGHPVGLSFSVDPGVRPVPRSLQNVYKELHDDLGLPVPVTGDLTPCRAHRVRTAALGGKRSLNWPFAH